MLVYVIEVSATGSIQWCLTKSFCFLLWGFAFFKEEDKLINFLLYMYKVIKNRSQPRAPSSFFDWNTPIGSLDFNLSKHLFFKHRAVHQNNMSIEYTVHYLARSRGGHCRGSYYLGIHTVECYFIQRLHEQTIHPLN